MSGKAVLSCRPNSHPFPERTLILDQPVKIGRSVARARPATNNAIFDCKVLSRNHALIWYNNGKFFLQDTKSSNGTFVNNHRLSKSGEESVPREVCSGDIVQFGVDVLENTRKVTHGCIVANLKLYLPDGKEAKASLSTSVICSNNVPVENLYELYQYLQEAIQREQLLKNKLTSLQEMLNTIREATDLGWKAQIAEDRLLTRINILESQLLIYSKNYGEDKLKEELKKLQEDMNVYQDSAKKFVKKILEEKLEAVQKYQDVKRNLMSVEAQCTSHSEELAMSKIHVQELAHKLSLQSSRTDETEIKLQEMEEDYKEKISKLQRRNEELEKAFNLLHKDETAPYLAAGKLVVDLITPATEVDPNDLIKQFPADHHLHHHHDDEELTVKDAADLLSAQLELLHMFGSGDNQNSIDHHQTQITAQIRNSDVDKSSSNGECDEDESPESKANKGHQILSDAETKDSKSSADYCGVVITLREDEELKSSDESLTNSSTLQSPSKKVCQDYDVCNVIKDNHLSCESKLTEQFQVIESPSEEDFENNLNRRNQNIEGEKDNLRKELVEAEQVAKQSKNEAAQLADRIKILNAELESLREHALDNKLRDELQKLTHDCLKSKTIISNLQAELHNTKDERSRLQTENKRLSEELDKSAKLKNNGNAENLLTQISKLEDDLRNISQIYMESNEERSLLRRQLNELQLDYQAISHQPYFNLFFALPCILLILAVTIVFYPTLSQFFGTSDGGGGAHSS
ncbi:hypothetical protein O3M35_004291 [Rhynocoris fuscipes]|uniref:Sarcolemmal membrane-associated protein n=1 Tax=Rhynocoris fuscipes TaxID=488301 RepID=A0AAW1CM70_9HEMI